MDVLGHLFNEDTSIDWKRIHLDLWPIPIFLADESLNDLQKSLKSCVVGDVTLKGELLMTKTVNESLDWTKTIKLTVGLLPFSTVLAGCVIL